MKRDMKSKLTYYVAGLLVCLMSAMTGCSEEDIPTPGQGGKEKGEIVDINVSVRTEETQGMTKAGIEEGVDGEDEEFWNQYDMRYILEVWKNLPDTSVVVHRDTVTRDNFGGVDFKLQLINSSMYDILFWADVVKQGSKNDLNYETVSTTDGFGLKSIYKTVSKANDNSCDAFTGASTNITINSSTADRSITLSRPVAKLITSGTIGDDIDVDSVVINYPSINRTYNAYTSQYMEGGNVTYKIGQRVTDKKYSIFDYIFVPKDIRSGETTTVNDVKIDYSVEFYKNNIQVANKDITQIPIGANKKTKVAVNGYTQKTMYKNGDLYTSPDGKYTGVVYNIRPVGTDPTSQIFDLVYNKFWDPVWYGQAETNIDNLNTINISEWMMPTKSDLLLLSESIYGNETKYRENISAINTTTTYVFAGYDDRSADAPWSAYWSSTKVNDSDKKVYVIWLATNTGTPKVENTERSTEYITGQQNFVIAIHKDHTN